MAQQESALQRFTRLAGQIVSNISEIDVDLLERSEQRSIKDVKRLTTDCRLDIRDWEYADTAYEREIHAKNASERLTLLRAKILVASEFGVFSAVDVAQLSAQIDAIASKIR